MIGVNPFAPEVLAVVTFLVMFAAAMLLFRVEYEMPPLMSGVLSFVVVFAGVSLAVTLWVVGPFTLLESTGYTGVGLVGMAVGAAIVS